MTEPDTADPLPRTHDASPYLTIPRRTLEQARMDIGRAVDLISGGPSVPSQLDP